ncbi:MAG: metal-dependent transcriptional regulator [Clostridia bacterium]|nr:metal-dependent transcriptional regulator [Clostridia bacterium]MBO7690103.1 metal-dependent transcriptional regulator [Clostridia bacterium]MBP5272046.1 metal-dependent transcriptional regulator [Clostridia bacterium]MBP5460086.1 metal-dependent transcriptional regulator [Clostridia bacterium]
MKLQESGEMYLKTILRLSLQQSSVRSIDISEFMGFSKPSVSRAVSILKESGYITIHEDKSITLTEEGRKIATHLYERQVVLSYMLRKMGVDEETAYEDACRMEHIVSDESFEHIKQYLNIADEDIVLSADPKTGLLKAD